MAEQTWTGPDPAEARQSRRRLEEAAERDGWAGEVDRSNGFELSGLHLGVMGLSCSSSGTGAEMQAEAQVEGPCVFTRLPERGRAAGTDLQARRAWACS